MHNIYIYIILLVYICINTSNIIYILCVFWSRKCTKNRTFSFCKDILQLREKPFPKAVTI